MRKVVLAIADSDGSITLMRNNSSEVMDVITAKDVMCKESVEALTNYVGHAYDASDELDAAALAEWNALITDEDRFQWGIDTDNIFSPRGWFSRASVCGKPPSGHTPH